LLLVSVSRDRTIAMNNLIALQSLDTTLSEAKGSWPRLAVADENYLLIAGNTADGLALWELDPFSGEENQSDPGLQVLDGDYYLSIDGTRLALIEPDERILVRDLSSNQEFTIDLPSITVDTINADGESSSTEELASIDSLAFNPDGSILAGGYCGQRRITVDPESGQESKTCVHNDITLWQVASGEPEQHIVTDQSSAILSLAYNPVDENSLAVGYQNGSIQFCDLAQGGAVGLPLVGTGGPVTSLAYHRDGDILVSGSANNLIALWNLNPPQLIGDPMVGSDGSVTGLALGEDHSQLYSASDQGTILLWDLELWKQTACEIAGRNLNPMEWDQFFPNQDYRATCNQHPIETPTPPAPAIATPTLTPTP
jgi:WD40 repeat protein